MKLHIRKGGLNVDKIESKEMVKVVLDSGQKFFISEIKGKLAIYGLDYTLLISPMEMNRILVSTDKPMEKQNDDEKNQLDLFNQGGTK